MINLHQVQRIITVVLICSIIHLPYTIINAQTAIPIRMYDTQPDNAMLPVDAPLIDNGSGIIEAFISSFSMIIVSELGDKTFFIAAILAMRHSRATIFLSAIAALLVMTILSVSLGGLIPTLLKREHTAFIASVLFLFFGFHLILTTLLDDEDSDELEEVETSLNSLNRAGYQKVQSEEREESSSDAASHSHNPSIEFADDIEAQHPYDKDSPPLVSPTIMNASGIAHMFSLERCFSPIFLQCFSLTFLAEWGDRSQISTIVMSASKNAVGVCLGGFFGHSICTGLAVLGGRYLAQRISERMVNLCGGMFFLIFSLMGFYTGFK